MELEENVAKGQNDVDLVIFTQTAKTRNIKEKDWWNFLASRKLP